MVILKKDLSDGYIIIDRNKINFQKKRQHTHYRNCRSEPNLIILGHKVIKFRFISDIKLKIYGLILF